MVGRDRWRRSVAAVSTPTLALLVYEQAQKALEQQERQGNELRQRTGTCLAAAAVTASFFGSAAIGTDPAPALVAGTASALAITVSCGVFVLYPHRLDFALDAQWLYRATRDDPEETLLRIAFALRDARKTNARVVERLARGLAISSLALAAQLLCWTLSFAVL